MAATLTLKKVSAASLLKIRDPESSSTYWGCDQQWFHTNLQRLSGCGPSVASNIIMYRRRLHGCDAYDKGAMTSLMEDVWNYVTPGERGIPSTEMLRGGMRAYFAAHAVKMKDFALDVPEELAQRPSLAGIVDFIAAGFDADEPVAFLNLCSGEVQCLDRWHWVTIIELRCHGAEAHLSFCDEGKVKIFDLALWLRTTTMGGGFAYFSF